MSFRFLRAACVAALPAAWSAGGAWAQSVPDATAAAPANAASAPAYRSAFSGYRAWAEPTPIPWPEANDIVGRVGGWRSYAREAQGLPPQTPASSAPGSAAAPQAPQGHEPSMHGGHR